jgi:hypothetical protein
MFGGAHRTGLLAVVMIVTSAASARAQVALGSFLQKTIGLSAGQTRDAARGDVEIRLLPMKNDHDVVVFGIIAIDVPRAFYVDRLKDFARSQRGPGRSGFGLFSTPASPADAESLVVTPADAELLRACRPGACDYKLPATDMANVRAILDTALAGGPDHVIAYARSRMVEYVEGYRARGGEAMLVYDDDAKGGVHASEAFAQLLAESPYVYDYVPSFHRYLLGYPAVRLDGVTDAIYWARDELPGMRPTLTINHIAVFSPQERPDATLIAIKQIFADHYFEAALDLSVALDRPIAPDRQGMYLILLRQYRFDDLPSGGLLNIRGRVMDRLRDRAEADLKRAKQESERAFRAAR